MRVVQPDYPIIIIIIHIIIISLKHSVDKRNHNN